MASNIGRLSRSYEEKRGSYFPPDLKRATSGELKVQELSETAFGPLDKAKIATLRQRAGSIGGRAAFDEISAKIDSLENVVKGLDDPKKRLGTVKLSSGEQLATVAVKKREEINPLELEVIQSHLAHLSGQVLRSENAHLMIRLRVEFSKIAEKEWFKSHGKSTLFDEYAKQLEEAIPKHLPRELDIALKDAHNLYGKEASQLKPPIERLQHILEKRGVGCLDDIAGKVEEAYRSICQREAFFDDEALVHLLLDEKLEYHKPFQDSLSWLFTPDQFRQLIKKCLENLAGDGAEEKLITLLKFCQGVSFDRGALRDLIELAEEKKSESRAIFDAFTLFHASRVEKQKELTITLDGRELQLQSILYLPKKSKKDDLLEKLVEDLRVLYSNYYQIELSEFRKRAWSSDDTSSHSIQAFATFSNSFSDFIERTVFSHNDGMEVIHDEKAAKKMFRFYLDLANRCLDNHNYAAAFDIFSGLSRFPVERVRKEKGWLSELVKHHYLDAWKRLEALFSPNSNFKAIRETVEREYKSRPIPLFSLMCKDISYIQEAYDNRVEGYVNGQKMIQLSNALAKLEGVKRLLQCPVIFKTDLANEMGRAPLTPANQLYVGLLEKR